MNSIGVIGSGAVGQVLAAGFARHGHAVTIGSRTPAKLADWAQTAPGVTVGHFTDAARADVVILAVQGGAAAEALEVAGLDALAGKVVIDTCNPIAGAPVKGILPYFTGPNDSLMQRLQALAPAARFVKAFNSVGSGFMIDPALPGGRPTMFICGDDAAAKGTVTALLAEVGWDAEDVGGVEGAGPIEALCQLWCAPGFLRNDWAHAFKVLKP
ncbi:MAG: NAD(P)-binding domain-containing protein [Pseudomonadota bacterium]|nr:NAD(P)-binding domain-containing protein [Pseudomonadota bacterium]